jgi:hypothetical protein
MSRSSKRRVVEKKKRVIEIMAAALAAYAGKQALVHAATYLGSKALDYGINKGIPKALQAGREYTYKRQNKSKYYRKGYKALTGIQKAYHSTPGQLARGVTNYVGQTAIFAKGGSKSKQLSKQRRKG